VFCKEIEIKQNKKLKYVYFLTFKKSISLELLFYLLIIYNLTTQ